MKSPETQVPESKPQKSRKGLVIAILVPFITGLVLILIWGAATDWRFMRGEPASEESMIYAKKETDKEAAANDIAELHSLGFKMVAMPGGLFAMGSNGPNEDEMPLHTVTVDSFMISDTEVTNAQYCAFLNALGVPPNQEDRKRWVLLKGESAYSHIAFTADRYVVDIGWEKHPVVCVSWYGAKAFCDFYGYRLPTEAEWEYAAGGPNHYIYPWGNEFNNRACCYRENKGGGIPETMPVKSFSANGYGLYDMAGNAWEWCNDWSDLRYYQDSPSDNPQGPSSGVIKVLRGGSVKCVSASVRCADRYSRKPDNLDDGGCYGFRCVSNS